MYGPGCALLLCTVAMAPAVPCHHGPRCALSLCPVTMVHAAPYRCALSPWISRSMAAALQANEALLKELPPPLVALEYYRGGDLYLFDDFQTSNRREPRRPDCKYDCCTKLPACTC